mmetsp:Transcript_9113/g.17025  ORF Transcript_9113/g.17025 Transcript_9113/m.17025 type:complete len:475 (-) Transcript_9113:94-1518(-)
MAHLSYAATILGALISLSEAHAHDASEGEKNTPHNPARVLRGKTEESKEVKPRRSDLLNPNCDPVYEDAYHRECESFCTEFFDVCVNPNFFDSRMGWDECVETCAKWPRTKTVVSRPPATFVHLGSDTFACRDLHLWEAQVADSPTNAAFHCFHSVADGASICSDSTIKGKTPYEHLRDGACTHRHYGYCDLSDEDTIADCMKAGITDENLPNVLKMLPPTVKILFLNENPGLTELPSGTFDNLEDPLELKAVYFDDCNIETVAEDAFQPLRNLQVLSLNFNKISVLQDDLLDLPELRTFTIFGDPTPTEDQVPEFGPGGGRKPGMLTSDGFTDKLFRGTPKLERLIMYGNRGIDRLHEGMFDGLSMVDTMFFVFCGLTNEGIPPGVFEPLESMVYFDFQGNFFTELDPEWFGDWSSKIERLVFFLNDIGPIEDRDIFAGMPRLKQVYLDQNPRLDTIPADFFRKNRLLDTLTL